MKHTPGPWNTQTGELGTIEVNSEGDLWKAIATVTANHEGAGLVSGDEAEANARLIAAAPELLAACKAVEEMLELAFPGADQTDARRILRAAIDKAERE